MTPDSQHPIRAFVIDETIDAAEFWRTVDAGGTSDLPIAPCDPSRQKLSLLLDGVLTAKPSLLHLDQAEVDRDVQEFARSLGHWRERFRSRDQQVECLHAGSDGLLILRLGNWITLVNRNSDEAVVDVGDQGAMWLGLATSRDVALHGRHLVLPALSGALLTYDKVGIS